MGTVQVRPSEDFEKKMSFCVVVPPQPVKARYATASEPISRDVVDPAYAGGWFTGTLGPKYGAVGAAAAVGAATPRKIAMRSAARIPMERARPTRKTGGEGTRTMAGVLRRSGRYVMIFNPRGTVFKIANESRPDSDGPFKGLRPVRYLHPGRGSYQAGDRLLERGQASKEPAESATRRSGMTLAERFIAGFRLPYVLACILIGGFSFGFLSPLVTNYAEDGDLAGAVAAARTPTPLLIDVLVSF